MMLILIINIEKFRYKQKMKK